MIEFRNVSKIYDTGTEAVHNASFKINKGDFAFLVGSSGSGKSTLLYSISGMDSINSGRVLFEETDICNMKEEDVPRYLSEVERLKSIYGDRINIYASMEIDYMDVWGPSCSFFEKFPLDYKIGSIHFIKSFVNTDQFIDVDGSFDNFKQKMDCHF